uniref:Vacuolar protein sorting-associated protein VPS9 n=1 Tax=Saccharomyces cerevisiae TaxID=4932 RepID=UPI0000683368
SSLIKKIEENERKDTLNTLQNMFPDMDPSLIEDVCIAAASRIGPCVDALLSLSE